TGRDEADQREFFITST
ncbi:unnamed protein product, partial [Allacma fusca]